MAIRAASGAHHSGIQIATRIAPVEVYADPLLPRVVYNLVENAIRHGGEVSRICVTTDERTGRVSRRTRRRRYSPKGMGRTAVLGWHSPGMFCP